MAAGRAALLRGHVGGGGAAQPSPAQPRDAKKKEEGCQPRPLQSSTAATRTSNANPSAYISGGAAHQAPRAPAAAMAGPFREKATAEEPAVIHKPRLAALIKHSFNALFLVICAGYIPTVYVVLMYSNNKWMALGGIAFVTPYFGLMLHAIPYLKGVYIEKYAMAPLDAKDAVAGKAPAGKV